MSDCPTKKMHSLYRRKKKKKNFFYFFLFSYIYTLFFIWTGQTVGQKWRWVNKKRRFYAGLQLLVLKFPAIWIVGHSRTVSGNWTQKKSTAGRFFPGGAFYMYQLNGISSSFIGKAGFSGLFFSGILSSGIMNLRTLIRLPWTLESRFTVSSLLPSYLISKPFRFR